MIAALIVTVLLWAHPAPQLWVCNPGHAPNAIGPKSNCERIHFDVLGRFPIP